jgi:choline dehydrogenase-like flavoprotein
VSRIVFDDSTDGDLIAIGAEFMHSGRTYIARSSKEVILSAGFVKHAHRHRSSLTSKICSAIRSPQLLELSGIGRRDVIENIGVELKVELPGVGENVQEHILLAVLYEVEKSFETTESLQDPEFLEARQKCL